LFGGVSVSAITIASVTGKCYNSYPQKDVGFDISNFHGVGEYLLSNSENRGIYMEYNPTAHW
jgi:hypothetical protein